jgi:hypothetical protein
MSFNTFATFANPHFRVKLGNGTFCDVWSIFWRAVPQRAKAIGSLDSKDGADSIALADVAGACADVADDDEDDAVGSPPGASGD